MYIVFELFQMSCNNSSLSYNFNNIITEVLMDMPFTSLNFKDVCVFVFPQDGIDLLALEMSFFEEITILLEELSCNHFKLRPHTLDFMARYYILVYKQFTNRR